MARGGAACGLPGQLLLWPMSSYPVSDLLRELSGLKALAIDIGYANTWLRPKLHAVLTSSGSPELIRLFQEEFAWDPATQSFSTQHATIDLVKLVSSLQKYLYERLPGQLGAGSYSVVYKARNRETNEQLAIKKLKQSSDGGFTDAIIREVSILRELQHENIVQLRDIITSINSSHVYLVLEYLDCDLRKFLSSLNVAPDIACAKYIVHQILRGIDYVHSHCILHRDLKPENVLINRLTNTIKLADFGLARQYLPCNQAYTGKVVTLYYRSPELLLGRDHYTSAVDMWSVGCILAEVVNLEPLFRADNESGLMLEILKTLGTPTIEDWPDLRNCNVQLPQHEPKGWDQICPPLANDRHALDLLKRLLTYDPQRRITAKEALQHPWFESAAGATAATPG